MSIGKLRETGAYKVQRMKEMWENWYWRGRKEDRETDYRWSYGGDLDGRSPLSFFDGENQHRPLQNVMLSLLSFIFQLLSIDLSRFMKFRNPIC